MRVASGERELVRAGAAGDPAAAAALWEAYGARVFAFCQRVLGRTDAAADAAQDAFLLAHAELGRLERSGESFGLAVFRAARSTSYELLGRDARAPEGRRGPASSLSAAAARLRPQQRAALALRGLEGLRYAEIAAVLGIGAEGVGALLARARLRVHDELHGTALAAAAVRSPDCEDVLALLAAASDGELGAADAGWADPHVRNCPTCPRTRRAMDEAAATYAAWSPAVTPRWLRAATLAELGAQEPAAVALAAAAAGGTPDRAAARATGAWTTPRPSLSAALVGATLLGVACAALLLSTAASLRQDDLATGGNRLPGASRSLKVAGVPAAPAARPHTARRTPRHARRAHAARRPRRVAFVAVRAVRRVTPAAPSAAARRPSGPSPRRPAARPKRAPQHHPSPTAPAPAAPAAVAPTPASAAAPADELPGAADDSTMAAVPASAAQAPAAVTPAKTTTTAPPVPAPAPAAAAAVAPPAVSARGQDRDRDGGSRQAKKPCPPAPRCQRRSCRR